MIILVLLVTVLHIVFHALLGFICQLLEFVQIALHHVCLVIQATIANLVTLDFILILELTSAKVVVILIKIVNSAQI